MKRIITILYLMVLSGTPCSTMPSATAPTQPVIPAAAPKLPAIPVAAPRLPTALPVAAPRIIPTAIPTAPPAIPIAPRPQGLPNVVSRPSAIPAALKPIVPGLARPPVQRIPIGIPLPAPGINPPGPGIKPASPSYQIEINQITTNMQKINTLKDQAKQLLRDLDKKLHDARTKIADAKKQSFEILRAESPQKAQEQLGEIKAILQEIQTLQTQVQTNTSKEFNSKLSEIKVQVAVIQTLLNNLKAKGLFATVQPATIPPISTDKKKEEVSLTTQLANMVTTAVAYTASAVKNAVAWLLKPPANEKKKKLESVATKPLTPQTTPSLPGKSPIPLARQAFAPIPGVLQTMQPTGSAQDMLEAHIPLLTKAEERLDQIRLFFTNQYQEVKRSIKILKSQLALYPQLKKHLEEKFQKAALDHNDMSIKQILLYVVSKTIDLGVIIICAAKDLTIKTYKKFIAPLVAKFQKDVAGKLKEIEEEEIEEAAETEE